MAAAEHDVGDLPEAEWDRVQGVMLRGVYLCMKYEIPHLLADGGAIVNTASGAGLVGYPGQSPYVSSKHGVLGLTKSAALEYGYRGVRVNAVCPGTVLTPMVEAATRVPGLEEQLDTRCTRSAASARRTRSRRRCCGCAPTARRSYSVTRSPSTAGTSFPEPLATGGDVA